MRLLIVDDSRVSRMMLQAIIKDALPESELLQAGNSDEALAQLAESGEVDIAIIDFNMPGLNGLELYERIKDDIPKKALLTANIQPHIRTQAEDLGVTFINKPINEDTIRPFLLS